MVKTKEEIDRAIAARGKRLPSGGGSAARRNLLGRYGEDFWAARRLLGQTEPALFLYAGESLLGGLAFAIARVDEETLVVRNAL
jgi:hypothetical protein